VPGWCPPPFSMMARLLALVQIALVVGGNPGGWLEVEDKDKSPSSRIHRLAHYAIGQLQSLCEAAEQKGAGCDRLKPAEMQRVESASRQVVSGMNYAIEARTSAGIVSLKIYEQSWTSTLQLTEAKLLLPSSGVSLAMVQRDLLADAAAAEGLDLGAARFAGLEALVHPPSAPVCHGGKVWSECGSPCEPTCDTPDVMCMMVCMAKCECPKDKPLWTGDACVDRPTCERIRHVNAADEDHVTHPAPAAGHAAAACVPHAGVCNRMYAPVCATATGTTYSNMCMAKAACVREEDTTVGRCPEDRAKHPVVADDFPAHAAAADRSGDAAGHPTGAHTPRTDGAATKALHLAEFALTALQAHCAGNNAIACGWLQGASVSEVVRASTQVVAGTNYAIQVRTSKGHTLHLTVFEQAWTQTFELTAASLSVPSAGASLALSVHEVVTSEAALALDAAAFHAYCERRQKEAAAAAAAAATFGSILNGGAPAGGATHGGHYTGSDAQLLSTRPADAPEDDFEDHDLASPPAPPALLPTIMHRARFADHGGKRGGGEGWTVLTIIVVVPALFYAGYCLRSSLARPPVDEQALNTARNSSSDAEHVEYEKTDKDGVA